LAVRHQGTDVATKRREDKRKWMQGKAEIRNDRDLKKKRDYRGL
jgi:hypothetical protein